VFCFEPGTYVVTTPMVPRERDAFVAAPGTILSGLDRSSAAFAGFPARASGVTVRGFVIEHFTGVDAQAAVITWSGWRVQSNQVRFNGFAGIRVTGTGSVVRWNSSHHNGRYGIIGAGSNILIEGNDISFNNTRHFPVWDAGGTKFTNSSGLTFSKNYVHNNDGPGLWADSNNYGVVYAGNRVTRNRESGIQHEISYDAVIRDNIVEGNALNSVGRSLWWGADIFVHSSPNVEIAGNTVRTSGENGIGLRDSIRTQVGGHGPYEVRNASVHDNTVVMSPGSQTGLVSDRPEAFTSFGVTFERNHYRVPDESGMFWEWQGPKSIAEWQAAGLDGGAEFATFP